MNEQARPADDLTPLRHTIRDARLEDETASLARLRAATTIPEDLRAAATSDAVELVRRIRGEADPGLMEVFLAEYGLSTEEGIALMCLAEALLRVPDAETIDDLIEDKIAPSEWSAHLGRSSSTLVNASTWGLLLTGRVLRDQPSRGLAQTLRGAVRRLGEPVIRTAVRRAMKILGQQFVLGETIEEAIERGRSEARRGFTFSYDMLGEAALTAADAQAFFDEYADAIARLAPHAKARDIRENPGISIKLSALNPRYEAPQRDRVLAELVQRVLSLAEQAAGAGMGLNIDAEEADRLDISLDVIEAVLAHRGLAGWDGFGVVVQAYGQRAPHVIDWLEALSRRLGRRLMVRLVKGAYWDTEVKRAQVEGLPGFPVYTRKAATDVSYLCCAAKLLKASDRLYPQFATHNAHSVAAILRMARDRNAYEFQRLHGMGGALHRIVMAEHGTRCRIYAPVGAHRDLLAYLVRRLLENGANSSFVNRIVDARVPPEEVVADPFAMLDAAPGRNPAVIPPRELFAPRRNSRGWDPRDAVDLAGLNASRDPFRRTRWQAEPIVADGGEGDGPRRTVRNPADPDDVVGEVREATAAEAAAAARAARTWDADPAERAAVLRRVADLYEAHHGELFALICREAGKALPDTIAELREAVDFLRYYAGEAERLRPDPRGPVVCISPWNFPLAIFTGQVAAALAAGNAALAKPAEASSLIAARAVALMHEAGVPRAALQYLPGAGGEVGAALVSEPSVAGVCFTGSTATAKAIDRAMAAALDPAAPLIAETGGLNAMIVDSTALPEQAVRDILTSAFQSAGQRCSALRMLYVQEDVAPTMLEMLFGAMDELRLGHPWEVSTDVGPVIDTGAKAGIDAHVERARAEGRLMKQLPAPGQGHFVGPAVIRLRGIADLEREVFGPILHVATYRAAEIDRVIEAINRSGYGLTFGLHTRIDSRVQHVTSRLHVGNMYVNRNQIGAIVGSQPFGGEGLSGTGPKAGGPHYLPRFAAADTPREPAQAAARADASEVQKRIDAARPKAGPLRTVEMPGPTGESNRLSLFARGVVLCLGPTVEAAREQARRAEEAGCAAVPVAPGIPKAEGVDGALPPDALRRLRGFDAVAHWGPAEDQRSVRQALAARDGPILPLIAARDLAGWCRLERHLCVDTTAAGGNAALLAVTS